MVWLIIDAVAYVAAKISDCFRSDSDKAKKNDGYVCDSGGWHYRPRYLLKQIQWLSTSILGNLFSFLNVLYCYD